MTPVVGMSFVYNDVTPKKEALSLIFGRHGYHVWRLRLGWES